MLTLLRTETFSGWLAGLRDSVAKTRINARLDRFALGNPGDVRALGRGLSEMRIDHGPGYRVYFFRREQDVVILLAGGDKRTQQRDIAKAFALMDEVREQWQK
jgi:putative addiction module killer protein